MTFVFRKIEKSRWYTRADGEHDWLGPDDIQSDALLDLTEKGNALSVFFLPDEGPCLERLLAAYGARREFVQNVDFALFDEQALAECGITSTATKGDTPDAGVNEWHRNLTELTVAKVQLLATVIRMRAKRDRRPERRVAVLIAQSIRDGWISSGSLKENILAGLKRRSLLD
jgi:hypothetical protein